MREVDIHREFPAHYDFELVDELPGTGGPDHYVPPVPRTAHATPQQGRDGLLPRVSPRGARPWIGMFATGLRGESSVHTMPDPDRLCVRSEEGFIVRADDPSAWEPVRAFPVLRVLPIPERGQIVFADFTTMCAYGPAGFQWKTSRLVLDDLEILEVTSTAIRVRGIGMRTMVVEELTVDLDTGAIR